MSKFEVGPVRDITGENGVFDLGHVLKGVLISYIVSVILLFISAVLITYSPIPDSATKIVVIIISIISIVISGIMVARKSRRQGWLNGAVAGLMYTVLLYMIGSLIMLDFSIKISTMLMAGMGFLFGAMGGIIGINMGFNKKRR